MTWQNRFDRLLKAMASGEPHKRKTQEDRKAKPQEPQQR